MDFLSGVWNAVTTVIETVYQLLKRHSNAISSVEEAKAKRNQNLFRLIDRHKLMWSELEKRPELSRILKTEIDLRTEPATTAEQGFLNRAFIYFEAGWTIAKAEKIVSMRTMAADVRGFFSRPLPYTIWQETKQFRNLRFVRFVDRAIQQSGRLERARL